MGNFTSDDWKLSLELALRGAVYVFTGAATLALLSLSGFASLIAVGGTGGFTSSLPPEHPAWFGLAAVICIGVVLQWALIQLHRYLLLRLESAFDT
ncbi:hypothetical protein GRI58_00010 [Porphyrobacter algicida]|uniref:Uncharacterized protein n=1 Tax=Qipengyuania algicida TaxID=1836209 RepID=A0A845ABZ4_9SPHN|nr:hypothetical protein [Qipengyuania algicida]MXP27204.1 hypothetical protein [Qipengyuania algicida]